MVPADDAHTVLAVETPERAVALGELLDQLAHAHPEWCTVVEMKHFLGFSDEVISRELGIPLRTVQRIWHGARKWLYDRREHVRPAELNGPK
jgi:DNA-directed RNA polymerase specialized sigma24 family protein